MNVRRIRGWSDLHGPLTHAAVRLSHLTQPLAKKQPQKKHRGPGIFRDRPLPSATFTGEKVGRGKKTLPNFEKMCEKLA